MDLPETCPLLSGLPPQSDFWSWAASVWCQMPLANTNGGTDWKCNISQWFQTWFFARSFNVRNGFDARKFSLRIPSSALNYVAGQREAAAGGCLRCRARCRRASPLPCRARSLPEPAGIGRLQPGRGEPRRRRSAAGAGRGRGPSFPFASRPAARGWAVSPARRARCAAGRRSAAGTLRGRSPPLPAHEAVAAASGRGGEERPEPEIAAPELLGCHHCSAGWPR